jgi:hypothetical protein
MWQRLFSSPDLCLIWTQCCSLSLLLEEHGITEGRRKEPSWSIRISIFLDCHFQSHLYCLLSSNNLFFCICYQFGLFISISSLVVLSFCLHSQTTSFMCFRIKCWHPKTCKWVKYNHTPRHKLFPDWSVCFKLKEFLCLLHNKEVHIFHKKK